jgi:hypothetical protein
VLIIPIFADLIIVPYVFNSERNFCKLFYTFITCSDADVGHLTRQGTLGMIQMH